MKNFFLACLMLFSLIACKKDKVPTPKPIPTDPSGYQQYGTPFTAMPATEDAVIYEVNLRAFSSTGDLQGVINRLTEIKALGINTIWLMPIYEEGILNSVNSPYCVKDYKKVQEMLGELVKGATAATLYWSRRPGKFVDRTTGLAIASGVSDPNGADFTGNVSMWYETLVETINDVSAAIHRKTLRGGANFVVCGPEVANILEFTSGFRANVVHDDAKGTIGAVKAGSLSKKWDVFVDPYFPRNLILVGRKGNSFLESGFVYAPYVPLQVTPTIFGTEDFVPRKGVMTRYAKKMVRPDMYGLVVVQDLLG